MPSAVPARPRANRLLIAGAALLVLVLGLCGLAASRYVSAAQWVEHSLTVDARRALDAGFQRHITKPVEPLMLVRVIAGLSMEERQKPRP